MDVRRERFQRNGLSEKLGDFYTTLVGIGRCTCEEEE